ncbi:META domain-containing protein [Danxiaibacter flavus]|uniref:META domain-containing protein n=1 Tax=Danxiaibacter flavus TaxID=3049108 RepID=A0ABV3Z9A5_9BACT|nr:META domain-containing protein [Chitinophagaceae bacterium DXS]
MKKNFSSITLMTLPLVFFICLHANCSPKAPAGPTLTGTFWQLSHAREVTYKPAKGVHKVYITLDESNKVSGFLGCNNLVGSYDISGGKASIKFQAASTRMICPGEAMKIEDALNAALSAATQYHIEGNTLTLMNDYGTVVADFVAGQK